MPRLNVDTIILPSQITDLMIGNHQFTIIVGINDEEQGTNAKYIERRTNGWHFVEDSFVVTYRLVKPFGTNFQFEIITEDIRLEIFPKGGQLNIYFKSNKQGGSKWNNDSNPDLKKLSKDKIHSFFVLNNILQYAMREVFSIYMESPQSDYNTMGIHIDKIAKNFAEGFNFTTQVGDQTVTYKLKSEDEGVFTLISDDLKNIPNLSNQEKLIGLAGALMQLNILIKKMLFDYEINGLIED